MPTQVSYHYRRICCHYRFFLDENSLLRRLGYEREISQLKEEIEKYRADYEENTKRLNEISTNPDAIEQIAREKYLMKKPNEDIYVFED